MNPSDSTDAPYDLLSPEYDIAGSAPLQSSYLICATPRSGSTLLAEGMHRTGVLAVPAEYLEVEAALPYLYQRWGCTGFNDYVDNLHRFRTGTNGLFGVKAHWHQLMQFSNLSQGKDSFADIEFRLIAAVLNRGAPRTSFLFVTRRDKVRQAVSHWVASKTMKWIKLDDEPLAALPEYSFDEIHTFTQGINASEEAWTRFFALAGVEPLRIVYEELVADYGSTVREAARYVGVDSATLEVPPPRMKRQSTQRSGQYVERYREDIGG